jgi:hypothetical protein
MADKIVREGLKKAPAARAVLTLEFGEGYAYLSAATHRLCRKFTESEEELLAAARERRQLPPAHAEASSRPPSSDLLAAVEGAPRKKRATRAEWLAHAKRLAGVLGDIQDAARKHQEVLETFALECERRGVVPAQLPEEVLRSMLMELLLGPRE